MSKGKNIVKRIAGTLMLPVAMYIVMMIMCYSTGKMYFGTWAMWKTLIVDIAVAVTCAMGIGLQFKCGRFDFSGGAIMLISVILAGTWVKNFDNNPVVFFIMCLVLCTVLSVLVGVLYVYGRLPIVIATIGMAMFYEALTALFNNGAGVSLVAIMSLKVFSTFPVVLIPLVIAVGVYAFYTYGTTTGKQAVILANNQQAGVNIGINEKKNVIISYVFSGIIFGMATVIYASTDMRSASFSSLSTVSELFSNILPVFIGLMLAGFCGDTIGTIMGSITLCLMSYGLTAVFSAEMGTAITTVITGVFILVINVVSAQGSHWIAAVKGKFKHKTVSA
ncbi:MAG TPA: hypothetical protein IAB46_09605 [Candidatus Scybalocola faecigallinarum]|uniref:ABC transporter permease n=1 Tax=Candidatus Scybalocola faecigallinarum TaxID=2840941 RepID=A0A9D1F5M5_9FIRM|nr:hypothetical protein [Candidatus Scybalocola faecigallinarum]